MSIRQDCVRSMPRTSKTFAILFKPAAAPLTTVHPMPYALHRLVGAWRQAEWR